MRLLLVVLVCLLAGCAFSNENVWTGKTAWVIGDAGKGVSWDESGMPQCEQEDCIVSGAEAVTAIVENNPDNFVTEGEADEEVEEELADAVLEAVEEEAAALPPPVTDSENWIRIDDADGDGIPDK